MKFKSLVLLVALSFCITLNAQQFIIGTYNLRYDNPKDSGNLWIDRAPVIASLIRFHDFDIFGTQEGYKNQLDDIINALPQYAYYGRGRDDGKDKGEHSAIFYKKDDFNLLDKGDFWLSQTPDQPSLGWDATCCNRICSWVYFQHKKSGSKFYFFNVHYDHQGMQARWESSKLILQRIKNIAGNEPVIFTGDFNGSHKSEWYQAIANSGWLHDTYRQVKYPYANNASHNGFGSTKDSNDIIDHIFITKDFSAHKWGLLTDTYHGKNPSDHFPVLTEIIFTPHRIYTSSNAHAHNDYIHPVPFYTAYNAGFGSIEADVFLRDNNQLYVAHNEKDIDRTKTLQSLYLDPLKQILLKNKGDVYADPSKKLILLIDLKTTAEPTLLALLEILKQYKTLTGCSTLKIVITGNQPDVTALTSYPAYIYFDGNLNKTYSAEAIKKIGMFSDNLQNYTSWNGNDPLPVDDKNRIETAVAKAHQLNKPIRFWGAPDSQTAWEQLMNMDVDFLNTDKISEITDFLNKRSAKR
ncbi:MAG: endonuclease [Chitinophagaceae bacterium]|nr:endonuclease [Chitinophagaceae bacterium]